MRRKGGLMNNQPKTNRLGLVIKDHREKGAIPQFYVRFDQEDPRWYYQHDLHRITIGGEIRMLNFKTNVPELDLENIALFRAASILESIGNDPNPTANQFYAQLVVSDLPVESHEQVTLAAISIETMMNLDLPEDDWGEPTIH